MESKPNDNKGEKLVLPEPTIENPFAQIDFLFNRLALVKHTSRSTISSCLSFYKRTYLAATNNYDKDLAEQKLFYVSEQWDAMSLLKLQNFFDLYNVEGNPNRLGLKTVAGYVTAFRQVLQYAALHKFTKGEFIHRVACAPGRPETTQNAAYSDSEMDSINAWLKGKLAKIYESLNFADYQRTGLGYDPRLDISTDLNIVGQIAQETKSGWENIDNLRWYFENVMDCQASDTPVHNSQQHYWFYHHASKYPGGYSELLKDWKIKPVIDLDIIMPLALKLSLETGLNPGSLWNLTVDCFQEKHPLTDVPFLQYYKARSSGYMEMHINPYDKDLTIREFKEGQANIIRKTIALIKDVTAPLRVSESGKYNALLFIFQNIPNVSRCRINVSAQDVRNIDNGVSSTWCKTRAMEDGLKADNGQKLQLTIGRFRSTKITDMVRRGMDFFEIKSRFGHKSIITTLGYVARNNIEVKAYNEINRALETIHTNRVWQIENQPVYAGNQCNSSDIMIHKGILSDCRNVFDPPEEIKRAKDYQPTHACTRYNMCLFCKNVILMRYHLPTLVVYRRQIRQSAGYSAGDLPNLHHYHRTLEILDSILDPSKSEFSREDLEWASAAAECLDEFIDPVVYDAGV